MSHALRNFALIASIALAPAVLGCGPSTPDAKLANVTAGAMPKEAGWEGVYYSPLFGTLHLKSKGGGVEGRWLTPVKDVCGHLQGTSDGNVLKFEWEQWTIGLVGPNSKRNGRGYFAYSRPEGENVDDEIHGAIGQGQDEVGTDWAAVKQRNVPAAPDSLGCGGGAADVGGGDFDKDSKETGDPEPPTEPK
jgi:hypothetical protein